MYIFLKKICILLMIKCIILLYFLFFLEYIYVWIIKMNVENMNVKL